MPDAEFDVAVIGGGIIGLSTAMQFVARHPALRIGVIEKDSEVALQQTGHNSGVIHSGIYYRPGSLKARFCVEGRASMAAFCARNSVPYQAVGKVIVATREEQLPRLELLHERGLANGVPDLQLIDSDRLREIEPHVSAMRALWAPHTSIVNYREVARAYARRFGDAGGSILTGARVLRVHRRDGALVLETTRGALGARQLVNCAGLHADRTAAMMGVDAGVRIIPFRGEYYTLRKKSDRLVRGLIYPVPDPELPFLGVHFTRNLKGYVEAGPNAVLATAREGYRKRDFSLRDFAGTIAYPGFWRMTAREWKTGFMEIRRSLRKPAFVRDLQEMIPEISADDLAPGGAGVRAQAVDRRGRLLDDFCIERSENAVHVLNAPSPGATSSLVIGAHIVDLATEAFSLN